MTTWLAGGALIYLGTHLPPGWGELAVMSGSMGFWLAHLKEPRS